MRKIVLDFEEAFLHGLTARREIHAYIAEKMDFPEYYGRNLDALYDCLTETAAPVTVGIWMPELPDGLEEQEESARSGKSGEESKALRYLVKVRRTFAEAEEANPWLAVWDLSELAKSRPKTEEI